jgi:hypothetical protein
MLWISEGDFPMYATLVPARRQKQRTFRGLGDVCTVDVNNNRVCGPSPAGLGIAVLRPVSIAPRISGGGGPVAWGANPPRNIIGIVGVSKPITPVTGTPAYPIVPPVGGWNYGTVSGVNATTMAQLIQQYNSNPASLTPEQWAQLQQAGVIPSTLPYSSASLVATGSNVGTAPVSGGTDPNCLAAGMTGGPYPNCTPAAATASSATDFLSTMYGPLTGLEWLIGAAAAYLLFMRGKR